MANEHLIADCETYNLLDKMTKLHMVQLGTVNGEDSVIYLDLKDPQNAQWIGQEEALGLTSEIRPLSEGIDRLRSADSYCFHNGIKFDMPAINKFFPGTIRRDRLLDTLVMARLAFPEERNHTLKAWGLRTGTHKGDYSGDYSTVDAEFLKYSQDDIPAGRALYHKVSHVLEWGFSSALEHEVAYWIGLQETNGFRLDVAGAQALDVELRAETAGYETLLKQTFGPIERTLTMTPKANNAPRGYVKGVPFTKRWSEEFNPSSRHHIAERLQILGWKPSEFGANGVAAVDEGTLAKLKFPEAKLLCDYFKSSKKLGMLSDGKGGWLKAVKADGRVYGRVNPNGARTGRMTHSSPNMAQVDKDPRMRALWLPRAGWKLVGIDAEGLEARMLAHRLYSWDQGALAERLVSGTKESRTDIHSANLKSLVDHKLLPVAAWEDGFKIGREGTKTILYAMIYGAGDWKIGESVRDIIRELKVRVSLPPSAELGKLTRMALSRSMVGFDKLAALAQHKTASPGYFVGLDGRHVPSTSKHSALNTLLQGDGAVVMKKALSLFGDHMEASGLPHGGSWGFCANVHDEVQIECVPELAEGIGGDFEKAITQAGVELKVRCPLAGSSAVGNNWAETH